MPEKAVLVLLCLPKSRGQLYLFQIVKQIKENYREELNSYGIEFEENGHSVDKIKEAHLVIKSPGIPPSATIFKEIDKAGTTVISEIEFASNFSKSKTICITGSNGKTTTVMLVNHILKKAGYSVGFGGNIGKSFFASVGHF